MKTVTVSKGDTLWALAQTHMGDPYRWPKLYAANARAIEQAQRQHSASICRGPDLIYPGTILRVPN